jgi:flagellar biosynthetic protein FliQ
VRGRGAPGLRTHDARRVAQHARRVGFDTKQRRGSEAEMFIDDAYLEFARLSVLITLKVTAPILFGGILIGLLVSIVQSITQIQEQTLTLVPKIFVMGIIAVILMPWIVQRVADFAVSMFLLT